jgi:hypothetical protein
LAISEGGDVSSGVLFVHSLSSDAFRNHVTENSHHSGTSIVDLGVQLAGLFFGVEVLSEPTNSVVSVVLGSRHPCKLDKGEEEKDLKKSGVGDGADSINTSGDIGELQVLRRRKVSIEGDVVVVDNDTDNSSHGNTSVLALDSSATLERLGFSFEPSKGVIDSKRGGDTDLKFIDVQGGGCLSLLGRGESGGGSGEEGGDSEFHLVCLNTERISEMRENIELAYVCAVQYSGDLFYEGKRYVTGKNNFNLL